METRENCKKLSFLNFPQFSAVFPSFPQFCPVFPSFPQFSPIFMTSKTSIFLRARRKNNGTPDRQEETHKKYIIHFTEIQFSPVPPSSAQFCPVFPSFIQFSSVLLSFSSNFIQFRPVSPSFAQFCPVLPSFLQFSPVNFYPIFINFAEFSSNLIQFQPTPSFAQFCPVLSNFVQFSQVSLFATFFPNNFGFLFLHQCLSLYSVLHFVLLNLFFCTILPGSSQEISVFYFYGCSH